MVSLKRTDFFSSLGYGKESEEEERRYIDTHTQGRRVVHEEEEDQSLKLVPRPAIGMKC